MKFTTIVAIAIALGISATADADVRLVGKTFSHSWTVNKYPKDWPTPKYVTLFCDEKTVVWNNVTDTENVYSGIEQYELTEIDPGILQVTWKESPDTTKFGITWTLNFRTWAIYGVVVNVDPKSNFSVAGGFSFRDDLLPGAPLAGCP
jgi:hypothetical protein